MKNNDKIISLIKKGISLKTLSKLNESQINALYKKVSLSEVTQVSKDDSQTINALKQSKKPFEVYEGDVDEGKKKQKTNPWAICTAQLGKEFGTTKRDSWSKDQTKKYERCVQDVKKQIKEGKDPLSLFLEQKISNIVKKHIPPRITKKDLMTYVSEQEAPVKTPPKTKPSTKPGKPGTRPKRPPSPFRNPNPKEQPAPKAQRPNPEEAKEKLINLIKNILEK